MVNFLVLTPSDIVIFPYRHAMHASVVANQGLPKINGYPPKVPLGNNTTKCEGKFRESKVTMISSIIQLGLIVELSTNWSIVGVSLNPIILSLNKTSLVMKLIEALK